MSCRGRAPTPPAVGRFTISTGFELDGVSHELRMLPADHTCRRNHGHNYVVTLTVTADELDDFGFVTDVGELAPFGRYLHERFDHRCLNDVVDFHPTSELFALHLARWFIEVIEPRIHGRLAAVRVPETRLPSALWERDSAP